MFDKIQTSQIYLETNYRPNPHKSQNLKKSNKPTKKSFNHTHFSLANRIQTKSQKTNGK